MILLAHVRWQGHSSPWLQHCVERGCDSPQLTSNKRDEGSSSFLTQNTPVLWHPFMIRLLTQAFRKIDLLLLVGWITAWCWSIACFRVLNANFRVFMRGGLLMCFPLFTCIVPWQCFLLGHIGVLHASQRLCFCILINVTAVFFFVFLFILKEQFVIFFPSSNPTWSTLAFNLYPSTYIPYIAPTTVLIVKNITFPDSDESYD